MGSLLGICKFVLFFTSLFFALNPQWPMMMKTEPTHISRSTELHIPSIKMQSFITSSSSNDSVSSEKLLSETGKGLTGGSCTLKRKRPPMLAIPNVLREILVDKELSSSRECASSEDSVCFSDSGVGVFSVKGKKKFMEDAHKIVSCSHSKKGFFGVYDGHGGSKAVEFVAENLHSNIFDMMKNSCGNAAKEEALKAAYTKTDQDFLQQGIGSGACCVTALIQDKEVVVSNVGDCRAVLCRGGKAEVLTKDHRAGQEDERRRIEDKGGYVQHYRGAWRVLGTLAVSRSIGDAHLKDWVPSEPDTIIISLSQDMEFLVLASDGLWEEVGSQEAAEIVMLSCSGKEKVKSSETKSKESTEYGRLNMSPSPKLRRVFMVKSPSPKSRKIVRLPNFGKTTESWKGNEDNFGCENESPPPSKAPRISLTDQTKVKTKCSTQENCLDRKPASADGLVAACKELVNLAVARGSLDDITVMIVDLSFFK